MKKVLILIYHQSLGVFLDKLKGLGMVHVDVRCKADDLEFIEQSKHIHRIKVVLKKMKGKLPGQVQHDNPWRIIEEYEDLLRTREQVYADLETLKAYVKNHEVWGDFDPAYLKRLSEEAGMRIRLLTMKRKKFKPADWKGFFYAIVDENKYQLNIILFEKDKPFDPSAYNTEEVQLPATRLSNLKKREKELTSEYETINSNLSRLLKYRDAVEHFLLQEESAFDYENIYRNLPPAVDGKVLVLNGWIPDYNVAELEHTLTSSDVAYNITRPEAGDRIPILLKNNRFARLFEPITKLFDLPNYGELDLTSLFAPFFALFFGLCLGDAGYGLIIFLAASVLKVKVDASKKGICTLGQILGGATFAIGLITGNAFGIDMLKITYMKHLVLFNQDQLFNVAIVIGLIQVLFGMSVKVVNQTKQNGFLSALATIGWMMIVIGLVCKFTADLKFGLYIALCGVLLILFFNDLKANIFVRLGKGLWELYGITGVFGDVLSYIRLFALGISSSILGFVVNDVGMQLRHIPWIGFPLAFIFLIVGHTGNLLISSLGSFVHPLRLTFVEFYKNAGFSGGGKAYKPFTSAKNISH